MTEISTRVAAVREAIRRHPWWTDSLLALVLTVISVGSVFARQTLLPFPVVEILVPLTTVPIAMRRYRPIGVLAVTVSAETLLLLFYEPGPVPGRRDRRALHGRVALRAAGVDPRRRVGGAAHHGRRDRQQRAARGRVIPELAVFAIAWVLGDNIRTRRAYLAELEARAARLEREREERDERAVADERAGSPASCTT